MKRKETGHRLFIGPFQPELEEALFAWVSKKKEGDPLAPVAVLVGSNLLGVYLRRLLVRRGLSHINVRFLTFLDLAKGLAAESLSRDGLRPLPRLGDLVLLSSIAEKIEPAGYFGPIARRRGFQRALRASFRDLWEGGIEGIPPGGDRKLAELGGLYQDYRSLAGQADNLGLIRGAGNRHLLDVLARHQVAVRRHHGDEPQGLNRLGPALGNPDCVRPALQGRGHELFVPGVNFDP